VDTCRPGLPINVLAAFADLSYNVGQHVVCDETKSTAARMLSSGDYDGACKQILKWTKAKVMGVYTDLPGLVKRRQMEYDICRQWR
jgi:lysozyme